MELTQLEFLVKFHLVLTVLTVVIMTSRLRSRDFLSRGLQTEQALMTSAGRQRQKQKEPFFFKRTVPFAFKAACISARKLPAIIPHNPVHFVKLCFHALQQFVLGTGADQVMVGRFGAVVSIAVDIIHQKPQYLFVSNVPC